MDTSKEYQNMCEKAVNLQTNKKDIPMAKVIEEGCGNFTKEDYNKIKGQLIRNNDDLFVVIERNNTLKVIQLFKQDQLQEMVKPFPGNYVLFKKWTEKLYFEKGKPYSCFQMFNSMEQLWLAFVMKEKFSLTWNGEDWV